jgi:hypothetical protein
LRELPGDAAQRSGGLCLGGGTVGWEDRDYYRSGGEDYLGNPAAILGFSVPFGNWFGVRVRLHFWLLVTLVFGVAEVVRFDPVWCLIGIGLLILTLLIHDFAHKAFAQALGGRHDEFMLWPAGGMIFPTIPPGPGAMFVAYIGPLAVHAVIAVACALGSRLPISDLPLNPIAGLGWHVVPAMRPGLPGVLGALAIDNWLLMLCNILPYYWFDGGSLWQSILWPMTGGFQAINITCIGGMVLAAPMFIFAILGQSFLGMVLWALLFSGSYTRRRQLQAEGTHDLDDAIAFNAQAPVRSGARGRRWFKPGVAQMAAKRNAAIRREREKIDQILAKVSKSGMNSLTWLERRALRKATERQKNG